MVRKVARVMARRMGHRVDLDDLVGAGTEGLVRALATYVPDQGARFESWAYARVQHAMIDFLRRQDVLSRYQRLRAKALNRVRSRLTSALGRDPLDTEMAAELGVDQETYHQVVDATSRAQSDYPLELIAGSHDLVRELEQRELRRKLAALVLRLEPRTQAMLRMHLDGHALRELAVEFGISESRVCQLLGRAEKALREWAQQEGLA